MEREQEGGLGSAARAIDAGRHRRVKPKPLFRDHFVAGNAIAVISSIKTLQGCLNPRQLRFPPPVLLLRHRLALQCIHSAQPADGLLIKSHNGARVLAAFPQGCQLLPAGQQ